MTNSISCLLLCGLAVVGGAIGCTRDAPQPPLAKPAQAESPKFRSDASAAPQAVTVIEDDKSLAYVRVQPEQGNPVYVHRDFIQETDGAPMLRTAGDVLKKPQTEETYFSLKELNLIRDKIPGTFMTASGRRVVGPWKIPRFEHEGEMAWPIYECLRADCPGREEGAEHGHLFILPDARYTIGSNPAQIAREEDRQAENAIGATVDERLANAIYLCPRCREVGKPTPDEALKQEFRRYKLPEAEAMRQALDDEYKRSRAARVRQHGGSAAQTTVTSE